MTVADAIIIDPDAVAAVKSYLRTAGEDEDAAIASMLAAAIAHGESFTGQQLLLRGVSETVAAQRGWQRLSRTPVRAVALVEGMIGTGDPTVLPVAAYAIDIDANGNGWARFGTSDTTRAVVHYTAGIADGWAGLPEAIRQGAIRLASHLYTHRDAADEGSPPAAVAALWRPWRRMRLA